MNRQSRWSGFLGAVLVGLLLAQSGISQEDRGVVSLPGNVELELVWLPADTFMMGCSPKDMDCIEVESPRREVKRLVGNKQADTEFIITKRQWRVELDGFWMGRYEVTQAQWQAVMGSNPSDFSDCPSCPVEDVSWNDIQEFLQKAGGGLRLPTEAEWEYGARGGSKKHRYGKLGEIAWHSANSDGKTHPVGQKKPNVFGLHDMLGNVWEWTQDWYGDYTKETKRNPSGPGHGDGRVIRGGGWRNDASVCRVSYRNDSKPEAHFSDLGFRVARSAQ